MSRNIENIESNSLVIESVIPFDASGNRIELRRFIARVPIATGIYTTAMGNELDLKVCPVDSRNNQKFILSGKDLPVKKQRGKPGQYKHRKSQEELGRVVEFPQGPCSIQRQQVGVNEEIIFRLESNDFLQDGDIYIQGVAD
ncbi:MAG: hypothetical protein HYV40_02470 [Candidatus Levybacteria bacterium]|nr:hypothetical protein [Candidatus Levybacteria bacterium]